MVAREIIFNKRSLDKLTTLFIYLENEWGKKVSDNFYSELFEKLDSIALMPYLGKLEFPKKNIRSLIIVKQIRVFYKIKNKTIYVINVFDTRQHPNKRLK